MTRQEIIDHISEQTAIFKAFVKEYGSEYSLNKADNVLSLLGDMLSSLQHNSIPDAFLPRAESMLAQIKIKKLLERQIVWKHRHEFE